MLKCEHCGALLTTPAEIDHGYLVVPCLVCGVVNFIQQTFEIIGYRPTH
jgi:phage FluMu protein Com